MEALIVDPRSVTHAYFLSQVEAAIAIQQACVAAADADLIIHLYKVDVWADSRGPVQSTDGQRSTGCKGKFATRLFVPQNPAVPILGHPGLRYLGLV